MQQPVPQMGIRVIPVPWFPRDSVQGQKFWWQLFSTTCVTVTPDFLQSVWVRSDLSKNAWSSCSILLCCRISPEPDLKVLYFYFGCSSVSSSRLLFSSGGVWCCFQQLKQRGFWCQVFSALLHPCVLHCVFIFTGEVEQTKWSWKNLLSHFLPLQGTSHWLSQEIHRSSGCIRIRGLRLLPQVCGPTSSCIINTVFGRVQYGARNEPEMFPGA